MKVIYVFLMVMFSTFGYAESSLKDYNLYYFGLVKHFEPTDETNEGNMNYIAISKTISKDTWSYDIGIGAYKDSYNIQSALLFTNIYSDKYRYKYITPMIGFAIHYKGKSYKSDSRKIIVSPSIKLRFGDKSGLFLDVFPVPKLGKLTNGLISLEFGYKF